MIIGPELEALPPQPLPGRRTVPACAAVVISIELASAFGGGVVAALGYALLVVFLACYLAFAVQRGGAAAVAATSAAMLLVPLCLRLVAVTVGGAPMQLARHYAVLGGTAVAALACAVIGFPELRPRLELSAWRPVQLVVALSGLPIGLACALAFSRGTILPQHGLWRNTPVLVALAIAAGVIEELLFRGFLQTALGSLVGRRAPALATSALILAYLGVRPVAIVVVAGALGFCSAVVVEWSGRLEGVLIGRTLLNSGFFVFWPSLLHLH